MLRYQELVFDDFVLGTVHTGVQHTKMLALGDRIGVQAILDSGGIGGQFTATIEHSADGINWTPKNPSSEIDVTIDRVLPMSILAGEADPPPQSLEYVRFALTVGGSREQVHVRLYVAMRDSGKGEFSACECHHGHGHDEHGHHGHHGHGHHAPEGGEEEIGESGASVDAQDVRELHMNEGD